MLTCYFMKNNVIVYQGLVIAGTNSIQFGMRPQNYVISLNSRDAGFFNYSLVNYFRIVTFAWFPSHVVRKTLETVDNFKEAY